MRSRSLLLGVLGRGRERTSHPPRAITLRTTHVPRHHCRRPLVIPGEVASPEPWKTLLREVVSKSDTKDSNHFSPSPTNRGIMRFYQTHSVLVAAFVSDLDTPHLSKALSTSGTT